ncbi:hypothetical protein, partial [Lacrimispora defluvii]|uniref:hypothetical protein n=1 Tax=Lacrimispora defluvii TaxID=2719233 RepID=UPI001A9A9905
FKLMSAYECSACLVGSAMCIRDTPSIIMMQSRMTTQLTSFLSDNRRRGSSFIKCYPFIIIMSDGSLIDTRLFIRYIISLDRIKNVFLLGKPVSTGSYLRLSQLVHSTGFYD